MTASSWGTVKFTSVCPVFFIHCFVILDMCYSLLFVVLYMVEQTKYLILSSVLQHLWPGPPPPRQRQQTSFWQRLHYAGRSRPMCWWRFVVTKCHIVKMFVARIVTRKNHMGRVIIGTKRGGDAGLNVNAPRCVQNDNNFLFLTSMPKRIYQQLYIHQKSGFLLCLIWNKFPL